MKENNNNKIGWNRSQQFQKDNQKGMFGERIMINYIENNILTQKYDLHFNHHSHSKYPGQKSKWKDYDVCFAVHHKGDISGITGKKILAEIKTDFYETKTDNLVFEVSCGGKTSGVFVTKADLFVYFFPLYLKDNVYVIKPSNLIKLLEENFQHCVIQGGDYGSATMMYKVTRREFNSLFKKYGGRIDTFNNYQLPNEINSFERKGKILEYAKEGKDFENSLGWLLTNGAK